MWMPPQTTVPPGATARSAAGTSLTRGREDERGVELLRRACRRMRPPTRRPASRAKPCAAASPARVKANTRRPSCRATWQTMWAAAPKP